MEKVGDPKVERDRAYQLRPLRFCSYNRQATEEKLSPQKSRSSNLCSRQDFSRTPRAIVKLRKFLLEPEQSTSRAA